MNSTEHTITNVHSGDRFFIMAVSDTHFDSPLFCGTSYRKEIDRAKELSKMGPLFFVIAGDLEDSDNQKMRNAKVGVAVSNNRYDEWIKESNQHREAMHYKNGTITKLGELLKYGKVLGAVAGNHYKIYPEGINSAQYIANHFKYPYLGIEDGVIRLNFRYVGPRHVCRYDIFFYHGYGQSSSADGGKIRAMINGIGGVPNVDMVIRGHSHDLETKPKIRFNLSESHPPEFVEKKTYFLSNGSMLRSYVKGQESYAELKNMKPNSLSWGEAELTAHGGHSVYSIQTRIMYS